MIRTAPARAFGRRTVASADAATGAPPKRRRVLALAAGLAALAPGVRASTLRVAVAANFAPTLQVLLQAAGLSSRWTVVSASSGRLVTQITQGAPFDVFLGADDSSARLLVQGGHGDPDSVFTYAMGRLALWSADARRIDGRPDVLRRTDWKHLAIANPKHAPYGRAALQVIERLNLTAALTPRLVYGESVAQAMQYAASGNAELAFISAAQALGAAGVQGSAWLVAPSLHEPLRQDAVRLTRSSDRVAAQALLRLLRGDAARATIAAHGYALPAP